MKCRLDWMSQMTCIKFTLNKMLDTNFHYLRIVKSCIEIFKPCFVEYFMNFCFLHKIYFFAYNFLLVLTNLNIFNVLLFMASVSIRWNSIYFSDNRKHDSIESKMTMRETWKTIYMYIHIVIIMSITLFHFHVISFFL